MINNSSKLDVRHLLFKIQYSLPAPSTLNVGCSMLDVRHLLYLVRSSLTELQKISSFEIPHPSKLEVGRSTLDVRHLTHRSFPHAP